MSWWLAPTPSLALASPDNPGCYHLELTGDTGAIMHSQATVVMDQPTTDGGGGGDNIQSRVAS